MMKERNSKHETIYSEVCSTLNSIKDQDNDFIKYTQNHVPNLDL